MAIRLTLDVFSGRENPSVVVKGPQSAELVERLRSPRRPWEAAGFLARRVFLAIVVIVERVSRNRWVDGLPDKLRVLDGRIVLGDWSQAVQDTSLEDLVCDRSGPLGTLRTE